MMLNAEAEICAALRDRCAPEYVDGKPTATSFEVLLMDAATRIERLSACVRTADAARRLDEGVNWRWVEYDAARSALTREDFQHG